MRTLLVVTLFASLLGVCRAIPTFTHEFSADTLYLLKLAYADAEDYKSVQTYVDGTAVFSVSSFTGLTFGSYSISMPVDAVSLPFWFHLGYHTVSATFYTEATFSGRGLTLDGGTYLVGSLPPGSEVPETTATAVLLGASLAGIFAVRRRSA